MSDQITTGAPPRSTSGTTTEPRLSLCAILGHEADVIDRWLEAFAPIMDELCIVAACGNRPPDETLGKVRDFCFSRGIPLRQAEYRNAPGNDWPHIDDFGAARQQAWDLATGDWQTWADADDILSPGVAALIRSAIASDAADWYQVIYDVRNMGAIVPRERIIRRGVSRWKGTIHETLHPVAGKPPGSIRVATLEGVAWIHAPTSDKSSSRARNLTITSTVEDRHEEWFFRGWDFELDGQIDEARRCFSASLVLDRCMLKKYRTLLHLSRLEQTEDRRQQCLAEAIRIDPTRREAHGMMAERLLDAGAVAQAAPYAYTSAALPYPDGAYGWSSDKGWRTYRPAEILQRVWRASGQAQTADADAARRFLAADGKISLLHATRGRAQTALATRRRWIDTSAMPSRLEHIFAIDADDAESIAALSSYRHVIVPPGTDAGGCAAAWNLAARASIGGILVQLSDDWEPFAAWDAAVFQRLHARRALDRPAVLAVGDGHRRDSLLCMAILTRARYEEQGHVFAPQYSGVYSDNEFTARAYRDAVVIEGRDLPFFHRHPLFAGLPPDQWDATHRAQNQPERYKEGAAIFASRNPDASPL